MRTGAKKNRISPNAYVNLWNRRVVQGPEGGPVTPTKKTRVFTIDTDECGNIFNSIVEAAASIGTNVTVESSTIRGYVTIGEDAYIEDSTVDAGVDVPPKARLRGVHPWRLRRAKIRHGEKNRKDSPDAH